VAEPPASGTRRQLPVPTELSREYWDAAARGELLYARCADCGAAQFPKEFACVRCQSRNVAWVPGTGRGTVYTFTVIHREPFPDFPVPSTMAIVELDEGYSMFSSIVDVDVASIEIGMPVQVTFERQNDEITLPMFRPAGPRPG
jgi:uncharacterized OB-fold protein